MRRLCYLLGVFAVAIAPEAPLAAKPLAGGRVACGSPHSVQEGLLLRQQRLLREQSSAEEGQASGHRKRPLARRVMQEALLGGAAAIPPAVARDIGEIAVIEATPAILLAPNLIDLAGRTVTIIPGPQGFQVQTGPRHFPVDSAGQVLALEDDDAIPVELPFAFPYYGASHSRAFVHSDGFITFEAPEASSTGRVVSRAAAGPPWIAPLFQDLDPSMGGQVTVQPQGDRVIVTWREVPAYCDQCVGEPRTARATLRDDGRIEFRYGDGRLGDAVVGIFPGDAEASLDAVDWSAPPEGPFDSGHALAEVFTSEPALDEIAAIQEFFRTHDDAYDTVIFFNDLDFEAEAGALAYSAPVRNEVRGTGLRVEDLGEQVGSARRLSTFINMGSVREYPEDPRQLLYEGDPYTTALNVLAHEIGHRFLAFARFLDPETGERSDALLGRQLAHWSFYFNSDASLLEGNKIVDLGPHVQPRFETVEASARFSKLDQYLMGLLEPSEVPATFLVTHDFPLPADRAGQPPLAGLFLHGGRKDIRVDDIVAADGARRPDTTVSQRHFRYGFMLLVKDSDEVDPQVVAQLERLRSAWLAFFETQFGARASAAASLVKMLHLSTWPAGGVIAGAEAKARVTIAEPRETDLVVDLRLDEAIAEVPATVTIRAGTRQASFGMRGLEQGAATLVAEAREPGFDRAVTRLAVRAGLDSLALERMHPEQLHRLPGQLGPETVRYRVRDENLVPYSSVELEFVTDGDKLVASAITDVHGEVEVDWPLGPATGEQVLIARLKGAHEVSSQTRVSVAPSSP